MDLERAEAVPLPFDVWTHKLSSLESYIYSSAICTHITYLGIKIIGPHNNVPIKQFIGYTLQSDVIDLKP